MHTYIRTHIHKYIHTQSRNMKQQTMYTYMECTHTLTHTNTSKSQNILITKYHAKESLTHLLPQTKKNSVGAVLSRPEFDVLKFRAKKAPLALLPVQKDDAQLIMVSQFKNDESTALLTTLDDYKSNPEQAKPYVTVHVFSELVQVGEIRLVCECN